MSPRTKEQFAEIRKQSTSQIAEAALELFARQGYHRTSIEQIARHAGVSKGLIYNYFDRKVDLLRHIMEDAMSAGDILEETLLGDQLGAQEKIFYLLDQLTEMLKQNPQHWKLVFMLSMQDEIAEKFSDVIEGHAAKNLGMLTTLLQTLEIPNADLEAMALAAQLDGILLHYIHMGDQYPLDRMLDHMKNHIKNLC